MGKFKLEDVEKLLVECHRCCCVCHRFCGVKIEMDHIIQQADSGPDTYENAIPLCFECHAEVHSYNPKHPRGRKFQPEELRGHRNQWLAICKDSPEIFRRGSIARAEVGPLQSLIDELEFNEAVASVSPAQGHFCPFKERQFLEAVRAGSIAVLRDELKRSINDAYLQMGKANHVLDVMASQTAPAMLNELKHQASESTKKAQTPIQIAKQELLEFLSSEG